MAALTLYDRPIFETFVHPGEVVEVRIIGAHGNSVAWEGFARGIVSGYFDDHRAFCDAVRRADSLPHGGIYFTLQVIDQRLIGRSFNRLKAANLTTSDNNVIAYRWLPIDIDPIRPAGVGSSDAELQEALSMREEVAAALVFEYGLPEPIGACSGNGGHLLVRLPDMPVDDRTKLFIASTLTGISSQFSNDRIKIDTAVHNPARIWKAYGTRARKGDAVPPGPHREARPHRISYIESMGI